MEPNVPTAAAAGSAVASDDEVNSAKNAAAVAARVAASRGPGWTRSSSRRMAGAPSRKPPALGVSPDEFSGQLVAALAALAQALGRDLAEADWWRLLDALVLVAAHPAGG
jgi:hypothetical protein